MKRKLRVLCYGDSNIIWGYMPGKGTRYPKDIRWTGRLAQCEELEVIEEGLNGRMTVFPDNQEPFRNGLDAAPCIMSHFPRDVAVIMVGTNDVKCRYSLYVPKGLGLCNGYWRRRNTFYGNTGALMSKIKRGIV